MRAILTYHSLDDSGSPISVSPGRFRRQMGWLESEGVRVVPLDELRDLPDSLPAVALTFDDGIDNLLTEGLPILEDLGWLATVFVVTRKVGGNNSWRGGSRSGVPTLPLLDWDSLGSLGARGWGIGSHSRHHPRLTRVNDAELEAELEGAAEDITAALGVRPRWFAYPYGSVDSRVIARASRIYEGACTTDLRPLGPGDHPMRLPRLDATYLSGPVRRRGWGPGLRRYLGYRRFLRAMRGAFQ